MGLVTPCPACNKTLMSEDLEKNFKVCPSCDHYFPLSAVERAQVVLDEGSFEEFDADLAAVDALNFVDKGSYADKLAKTQKKTGRKDAMVIGRGNLRGRPLIFGSLDFGFMGGSMGVVVGEKVTRAAEAALAEKKPLLLFSASGGARMHEGALSLMQMAKSCAALQRLHADGGLFVSVMAHPTTGGVTASWATMGDVLLAEPKALIGFAGPRVIKNTIRQDLPEGFQTAEFLLEKGQIDRIVHRHEMVEVLDQVFTYCLGPAELGLAEGTEGAAVATGPGTEAPGSSSAESGDEAPATGGKSGSRSRARAASAGKGRRKA